MMKLHLKSCTALRQWYSCASRVISFLTNEPDEQITRRVMHRRINVEGWSVRRARRNTQMMWDCEVRFELRKWLRKTRCIYPRRTTTLLQLSRQLEPHEYALVMLPLHIVIIHDGKLYDAGNFGEPIINDYYWRSAKVRWYQRLK